MEIPPEEQYQLQKLRILTAVQDEVVAWTKKKLSIFVAVIAVVGLFGAGGFITLTVGEKIEKEMQSVDGRVLDAVKSAVQAELSAKQATEFAERERKRLTKSANDLSEVVDRIRSEAESIENRLKTLSASIEGSSENVRGEARLLADELEKRIKNVEEATLRIARKIEAESVAQTMEKNTADLKEKSRVAKQTYSNNKEYQIQIPVLEPNIELAETIQSLLRKIGYQVWVIREGQGHFTQTDFNNYLLRDWGLRPEAFGQHIIVMYASGNKNKGEAVATSLRTIDGITDIKLELDKESKSDFHIGIIISPDIKLNP